MGLFGKSEEDFVNEFHEGVKPIKITLPEYETVPKHGGVTKAGAVLIGGLIGYALTSGTSNKRRTIKNVIKIVEKGVIIQNGSVDGSDLRIPWENIISVSRSFFDVTIILTDNQQIDILFQGNAGFGDYQGYPKTFENIISSNACGAVEEGW